MTSNPPAPGYTLYLDFDGVLNGDNYLRHQRNHVPPSKQRLFDPENMAALARLCKERPVKEIVITSSWRIGRSQADLVELLEREGFQDTALITGFTEQVASGRSDEIRQHIAQHNIGPRLILDDSGLVGFLPDEFYRTSPATGFTDALCSRILRERD